MIAKRIALVSGVVLLSLTIAHFYQNPLFFKGDKMTANPIPIEITLSETTSTRPILGSAFITVTLTNKSPQPLSFLRWSSPLDNHAPAIGVYNFTSLNTGDAAPCLDMKINHRMPQSGSFSAGDDNIIRIPASGMIERVLQFKEPEVILSKGEKYKVKASGNWMGVWIYEEGKGEDGFSVDECSRGEFQSNEIIVDILDETTIDL